MILKRKTRELMTSLSFLAPSLVLIYIFVYQFIGNTFQMSFLDWNNFSKLLEKKYTYIGFENFKRLFQDPRFITDLWNTAYFTIFFLLGCLSIGIFLALLIEKNLKGSFLFQNLFLFPMALAFVVTGTVWRWIFAPGTPGNPQGINLLLQHIGLTNLQWEWFTTTKTWWTFNLALIPLVIAAVWQFSGYVMTMWLAGLRSINEAILDAATVDGASEWELFWRIKFPILKPITLSAVIVLGHISLKIFDLVYAMTGSGSNNATDVPSIYMFETTFKANRYSIGSSIAVIMLMLVTIVIIPYIINSLKKEHQ